MSFDYQAPWWARNPHLNTILGVYWPAPRICSGAREEVSFSDQDRTSVFICEHPSDWVVLIFHGLAGSAQSKFSVHGVVACEKMKVTSVAINLRNAGDAIGLSYGIYHSGRGDDVGDLVQWARGRFPEKKIMVIGCSLGASMIMNLRVGRSGTEQPDFAVAVNPPLDLADTSRRLTTGFGRIYGAFFTKILSEGVEQLIERKIVEERFRIPKGASIFEFDEYFTAPMSGFENAQHYYSECCAFPYFSRIKDPTLVLASLDDPFIDFSPLKKFKAPKDLKIHLWPHGGHVGLIDAKGKWIETLFQSIITKINAGELP